MFYQSPDLFENFNPLNAKAPKLFHDELENVLLRSRKIISSRSLQEIKHALDFLRMPDGIDELSYNIKRYREEGPPISDDWIPEITCSPEAYEQMIRERQGQLSLKDYEEEQRRNGKSEVGYFTQYYKEYDLDNSNFHGGKWSEYFALMAIGKVAQLTIEYECCISEKESIDIFFRNFDDMKEEAREAIFYAEHLLVIEKKEAEQSKLRLSHQNSANAVSGHKRANQLKDEFIQQCLELNPKSVIAFGRKFFDQLSNDDQKKIALKVNRENGAKTLQRAYRKYKKTLI